MVEFVPAVRNVPPMNVVFVEYHIIQLAISSDGHSLDLNINLIWGIILLLFGVVCLAWAWNYARKRRRQTPKT